MLVVILFLLFGLPVVAFIVALVYGLISTLEAATQIIDCCTYHEPADLRRYLLTQERLGWINNVKMAEET